MSIDGQMWRKNINFYPDSTCYSSPRTRRCGENRSDVCPAAEPWPPGCPWAPTGTAGAKEQGPYIQFLSGSCPVEEQSHRADHEAGPHKEQNIQGGRILLREKQHMVGLWQKDNHVTSRDVCIDKFCFAFQKTMQISSPAESLHDYNKAFLINGSIASHSKGRNERTVRW